jgi:hypothetical protein
MNCCFKLLGTNLAIKRTMLVSHNVYDETLRLFSNERFNSPLRLFSNKRFNIKEINIIILGDV